MINLITDLINFTQPTNLDKESLSVIESIAKIKTVVNECIKQFNNLENKTDEDYNNFLSQIRNYKNEINKLMNSYKGDVYEVYNEFKRSIENLDKINESVDYVKEQSEIVQRLAEENANKIKDGTIATHLDVDNAKTSIKEELSINMVNFVNVDKMKGNSDTEKIKNAINKANEKGGGELYLTGTQYTISECINIPKGISINFGFARIVPSDDLEGFMFSINSSDLNTWDTQYPNIWKAEFKNANFNNLSRREGVKGIFNASQHSIKNIQFSGMTQCIKYSDNYLDSKVVENISISDTVGTEYQIDMGFLGDGVDLRGVHGKSNNLLKMNMCNGGTIKNCILNGKVYIANCTALSIEGCHMENGYFNIMNSEVSVKNIFAWKQSEIPFISITQQNSNAKPIILENIKIVYPMYNNIKPGENDIEINGLSPITFKNVYTSYELSGSANSSYHFGVKTNKEWFNKYTAILSMESTVIPEKGIINTLNNLYTDYGEYDKGFIERVEAISDTSNTNMNWVRPVGTYFYRADIFYDNTRMIGCKGIDNEKSVEVSENQMVRFLNYGKTHMSGAILRLYRGTQSGVYDEYVDIPICCFSDYLKYDKGDSISNIFKWVVNPTKERLNLNETDRFIINGKNVICYMKTAPSCGTWVKGDIVYNNNPSRDSYEKWIYTGSEWIGVNQL